MEYKNTEHRRHHLQRKNVLILVLMEYKNTRYGKHRRTRNFVIPGYNGIQKYTNAVKKVDVIVS